MAHAAKIDKNGIVRQVLVVDNDKLFDGGKFTTKGEKSLNTYMHSLGLDGDWKLTSYNSKFRGSYAGQGFIYDTDLDEFIAPEKNGIEEDPNA
jgi:hypothetical protein